MSEFWERSKKASMLTFKDVWFVRSIEGMKAQVNESISRIKMRVHIIAPRLEDVDLIALSNLKKHINIRISTNFNWDNPEDQVKLQQIVKYPNIDIRLYSRENLWAINRDFEEVVVCVVSKMEEEFEIAGMGSILEEHVKLFAAVLEDVWIQSKKVSDQDIVYSVGRTVPETPKLDLKNSQTPQTPFKSSLKPSMVNEVEPLIQKPHPEPRVITTPSEKRSIPTSEIKYTISNDITIAEFFQKVIEDVSMKTGSQISSDLEQLRNKIVDEKGYSSVLNQMSITIASLKTKPRVLNQIEISDTIKKIQFWQMKLNI
jgi:hypothetical protein